MMTKELSEKLKQDGLTFEEIQRFDESLKQIERGEVITLKESKESFIEYRKNLVINKKEILYV